MNRTFLLLSLSLMACAADAQQSPAASSLVQFKQITAKKHSNNVNKILHVQAGQMKTTAARERIASYGISQSNGTSFDLVDSSNYRYSNARGSQFDFAYMEYDDYSDQPKVLFDSLVNYSNNGSGLDLASGKNATYNTANQPLSIVSTTSMPQGSPLSNNLQTLNIYDGTGNNTATYHLSWNTAAAKWDTTDVTNFTYNTNNKAITAISSQDNGGVWALQTKDDMTYDGSGNLTQNINSSWNGTSWDVVSRETLTYNGANKLITSLVEDYNGTGYVPNTKDSFNYANTDFYTYDNTITWNIDSNRWDNYSLEIKHLNSKSLPDTINYYQTDSMGNYALALSFATSFNTYNDPVESIGSFFLDSTTSLPVIQFEYHYETYFDLAVKDVVKTNAFSVYPNPANDVLNIKAAGLVKGNITAQLMNVTGQLVLSAGFNSSANMSLSVSALQPGTYLLVLKDAQGNKLHAQSVVKQ